MKHYRIAQIYTTYNDEALVRIMGFPITGCPSLGLGLSRYTHMCTSLSDCRQPALAQKFLPGREFNVGIAGGSKLRVLCPAKVQPELTQRIAAAHARRLPCSPCLTDKTSYFPASTSPSW